MSCSSEVMKASFYALFLSICQQLSAASFSPSRVRESLRRIAEIATVQSAPPKHVRKQSSIPRTHLTSCLCLSNHLDEFLPNARNASP
jgi:hypothetical protein